MKKLNNKGFTLIELLAVVVIMLIISVIAIPSIGSAVERNKTKKNEAQIKTIESYAEVYYASHKNSFPLINDFCVSIDDLGLSDSEKTDPWGNEYKGTVEYSSTFTFVSGGSCS